MHRTVYVALLLTGLRSIAGSPGANDSVAIAVARAHIEAWSHHDWEKARMSLASDVHVTVTTTTNMMASTDTTGADVYMDGLKQFATGVEPGSAKVLAPKGDDHNALVMVTVRASFGPNAPKVTIVGARLYLLDDQKKIKVEQVVFFPLKDSAAEPAGR